MIVYFSSLPIASVEFLLLQGKPGMTISSMIRIGLSYEPRTQRPLTPREMRTAKRGVYTSASLTLHRFTLTILIKKVLIFDLILLMICKCL